MGSQGLGKRDAKALPGSGARWRDLERPVVGESKSMASRSSSGKGERQVT